MWVLHIHRNLRPFGSFLRQSVCVYALMHVNCTKTALSRDAQVSCGGLVLPGLAGNERNKTHLWSINVAQGPNSQTYHKIYHNTCPKIHLITKVTIS